MRFFCIILVSCLLFAGAAPATAEELSSPEFPSIGEVPIAAAPELSDIESPAEVPVVIPEIPGAIPEVPATIPTAAAPDALGRLLDRAMELKLIAGGVVVVGNREGIIYTTGRGRINDDPASPPLNDRTIFDLASLTKVIATTPAVMKLLDEGRISLLDPISRWFPEFTRSGTSEITVLSLLTHTSGLFDFNLLPWQGIDSAIRMAAEQKGFRPGSTFRYADINFILLAELVHRVSGRTLDRFCREELFEPLGATQTMFLPPPEIARLIAPTAGSSQGEVQDRNARRLGGVAGHAGLFSSGFDLSLFARMILGGGEIEGRHILSERVINQMTVPYFSQDSRIMRALGWDMVSPYSAPKGTRFSEISFGHTGYSGSSIWIDPERNLFVILLTTRLNYCDVSLFNQLRRQVSTVAAAYSPLPGEGQEAMSLPLLQPVTRVGHSFAPRNGRPKLLRVASLRQDRQSLAGKKGQKGKHRRKQTDRSRRV